MKEEDIKIVADFLHRAVQLSLLLQKEAGSKLLKDFVRLATTQQEGKQGYAQVKQLRDEVRDFASKWPLPGIQTTGLQKPAGYHEDF
jgi:glycine hydroxymethyltransferase